MVVGFASLVNETLVVRFCACAVALNSAWVRETGRFPNRGFQFQKRRQLFISARTMNRFPLSRCASAIQIVRPLESTAETQPQRQPALLRLSAINFAVPLLRTGLCHFRSPPDKDNAIGNLFHTAASINVRRIFAGIAQLVEQLICNQQVVGSNPTAGFLDYETLTSITTNMK